MLDPIAAWYVADILRGTPPPPPSGAAGRIAFKTGTSYGHRDAWAIGFDGAHVIGVWFGRAGRSLGAGSARSRSGGAFALRRFRATVARPHAPSAAAGLRADCTASELPVPLRRFHARGAFDVGGGPQIAFPPDGARVDLGLGRGAGRPLAERLGAGAPPFRWLVDGAPIPVDPFARQAEWRPDGVGFIDLAVIDATGRAARVSVSVE